MADLPFGVVAGLIVALAANLVALVLALLALIF